MSSASAEISSTNDSRSNTVQGPQITTDKYSNGFCTRRTVFACGFMFTTGAIAGGLFGFLRELHHAPKGIQKRFIGGFGGMRTGARQKGVQAALIGFTFASIQCMLEKVRKKDDRWNDIGSGVLTGALSSVRQGVVPMIISGVAIGLSVAIMDRIITKFDPTFRQVANVSSKPAGTTSSSTSSSGNPTK